MDYTKQPLWFRLRKTMRYISMYGLKRTWIKVQGQLHMKKRFDSVPESRHRIRDRMVFGLIGCGNYGFSNIAYYLRKKYGACIRACMDADIDRAVSLGAYYGVPLCTDKAEDLIDDPAIRLIYIASNHASHAEYAIQALEKGKNVYIEKPHVVREEQLARLVEAMERSPGMVFLGYNRPGSRFGRIIREYLDREPGSAVINWFVAGHEIAPDHWYFKPEEGGRVLGNLCHWTDFTLVMAGADPFPVKIIPTRHEKSDSDIAVTYVFGNGTVAAITFSAKGHTFEGVKERLSVHKGDCLITMDDYKKMTVEVVAKKRRFKNRLRDHGHQRNILRAAETVLNDLEYGRAGMMRHVADSGWLMLKTKEALDHDRIVMADPPFQEK
jgi:predicted dehydrogenase